MYEIVGYATRWQLYPADNSLSADFESFFGDEETIRAYDRGELRLHFEPVTYPPGPDFEWDTRESGGEFANWQESRPRDHNGPIDFEETVGDLPL
jgi:hypothetical protein